MKALLKWIKNIRVDPESVAMGVAIGVFVIAYAILCARIKAERDDTRERYPKIIPVVPDTAASVQVDGPYFIQKTVGGKAQ